MIRHRREQLWPGAGRSAAILLGLLLWGQGRALAEHDEALELVRRFPAAWSNRHEDPAKVDAHLRDMADAVRKYPRGEQAALLSLAQGESAFALYVRHDCVYRPKGSQGDCDKGKARGPWQLHAKTCPALHALPRGEGSTESLAIGAECAVRLWRFARRRCGTLDGAVAAYAGRSCAFRRPSMQRKVAWMRRLGLK